MDHDVLSGQDSGLAGTSKIGRTELTLPDASQDPRNRRLPRWTIDTRVIRTYLAPMTAGGGALRQHAKSKPARVPSLAGIRD